MKITHALILSAGVSLAVAGHAAETLTIATVNNGDMIRMQRLSKVFEQQHPDIKLNWVVLEENVLRQRLTTDIATQGGQIDVLTIGTYETPLWGAKNWLEPMTDLPADYDVDDIFPAVRQGLSVNDKLYALPFYGESTVTYYRTDLFTQVTLQMMKHADPSQPSAKPVPYVGIQYVVIPEFQSIGTSVGKLFSAALTGQMSVDQALASAQSTAEREMKRAGYPKK